MFKVNVNRLYTERNNFLLALVGGLIIGFSCNYSLFPLMWFGMVPLLMILEKNSFKASIPYLFFMSVFAGVIPFFWMLEVAQRYSGTETHLGLILILFPLLVFFIATFLFSFLYSILVKGIKAIFYKILATASLWVVLEWLGTHLFNGIPWQNINLAYTQLTDLYILQTASWGGIWSVSFVLLVVNGLAYHAIIERNRRYVIGVIIILAVIHIYGWASVVNTNNESEKSKLRVAVITENIKPEDRWADNSGRTTDEIFYQLNSEAIKGNPNLIIWSESAVPWAFETDNSFIINVLEITYPVQAYHLMGLMMPNPNDTSLATNSAIFFAPDGAIKARYDKQELLKFLEYPFITSSLKIPFLTQGLMNNLYTSQNTNPLNTPIGKIGTLICNESIRPFIARKIASRGAQYFVTMSNDSWFEGTRMDVLHFYINRVRAIENRKNMIVNSNRGISGNILPSGEIIVCEREKKPNIFFDTVTLTSEDSFYSKRGDLFLLVPILLLISLVINHLKIKL